MSLDLATQIGIDVCGPERASDKSQFFTPPRMAEYLVRNAFTCWPGLAQHPIASVLEPTAGDGRLVRAVHEYSPATPITAVELDARMFEELTALMTTVPSLIGVVNANFLALHMERRFSLAVMNPPFHKDPATLLSLDGPIIGRALDLCDRVATVIRTESLQGVDRHKHVWGRPDVRAIKVGLPVRREKYGDASGQIETCAAFISKVPADWTQAAPHLEWW